MKMTYKIYQLKHTTRLMRAQFRSYQTATLAVSDLSLADYEEVWNETLTVCQENYDYLDFLNGVYRVFNIAIPKGYKGHNLSVSDIIEVDGVRYYVDSFGFVEINDKFEKISSVP